VKAAKYVHVVYRSYFDHFMRILNKLLIQISCRQEFPFAQGCKFYSHIELYQSVTNLLPNNDCGKFSIIESTPTRMT
jgi:hypothetical protein